VAERQSRQLSDTERLALSAAVARALGRLNVPPTAPPAGIVKAVDDLVEAEQIEREKYLKGMYLLMFKKPVALIAEMGAVWGEQVVRELSWAWQFAARQKEPELAIVAPERTHIIFPEWYIRRMLRPPYDDNTLMLMFNMLKAGNLPTAAPGAMEDLTGTARHIVPKRLRPLYRRE
jgi:hypothetical protein